jgi:signal transduction histidine kinase
MPQLDGISLLKRIKSRWPFIEVIVITGYGTIEIAIDALKVGAYDFILKPVNFDHLEFTINKCFQKIVQQSEGSELREKIEQLKELNDMKDKFFSITNHEIRTPLMILRGYFEILETELGKLDKEKKEIFEIIKKTSLDLSETVERMHILSHMNHGDWIGSKERIDVTEIISDVYNKLIHLFEHRKIKLSLDAPDHPIWIEGNSFACKLLIRELLHNSLKFTQDDGEVKVKAQDLQDQVVISISDDGIGIPYDKQQLIFTDFYELQNVMNHKSSTEEFMGGGMGIGLNLVKEIITGMNGKLQVFSETGEGSTFIIFLPKKEFSPDLKNAGSQKELAN